MIKPHMLNRSKELFFSAHIYLYFQIKFGDTLFYLNNFLLLDIKNILHYGYYILDSMHEYINMCVCHFITILCPPPFMLYYKNIIYRLIRFFFSVYYINV